MTEPVRPLITINREDYYLDTLIALSDQSPVGQIPMSEIRLTSEKSEELPQTQCTDYRSTKFVLALKLFGAWVILSGQDRLQLRLEKGETEITVRILSKPVLKRAKVPDPNAVYTSVNTNSYEPYSPPERPKRVYPRPSTPYTPRSPSVSSDRPREPYRPSPKPSGSKY